MDRMLIAIGSGMLEGLLICVGIFTRNPIALAIATVFFIAQWKHLGRSKSILNRKG